MKQFGLIGSAMHYGPIHIRRKRAIEDLDESMLDNY